MDSHQEADEWHPCLSAAGQLIWEMSKGMSALDYWPGAMPLPLEAIVPPHPALFWELEHCMHGTSGAPSGWHFHSVTPLLQLTGSCCLPRHRDNFHGGLMAQLMRTMKQLPKETERKQLKLPERASGLWEETTQAPLCRPCTQYRGPQSIICTDTALRFLHVPFPLLCFFSGET